MSWSLTCAINVRNMALVSQSCIETIGCVFFSDVIKAIDITTTWISMLRTANV